MAIERRLTEIAGPVGGKLHTGALAQRPGGHRPGALRPRRADRASELVAALMARLLALAEAHRDWRMPGYTHLQRAQPVYLGHHLLAYFWMLERDAIRFDFARRSTMAMPLGSGALAGPQLGPRPRGDGRRARLRAPIAELDRRRLQPRLRARLPVRGDGLRDPPVPPGLGARDLVEPRVRLLRARRRLRLRVEPDAAEEEPRRGRAAAGEVAAGRRLAGHPARASCTRCRSPTPRTCRRTRRRSSTPSTRSSSASRPPSGCSPGCASTASGSPRRPPTSWSPPPTSPTCWSAGGCRSARPTASSAGSCAPRSTPAARSPSSTARSSPSTRELLDDEYYEVLREGAWLDSKRLGRRDRAGAPRPSSSSARGGRSPRSRPSAGERLGADFFDRSVHEVARDLIGCELLVDGRRRGDRRDRELRARRSCLPRLRRAHRAHRDALRSARAAPTSISPTASTAC